MRRLAFLLAAVAVFGSCSTGGLRFEKMTIPGQEEAPDFWRVRPEQIVEACEHVSAGRSGIIAHTPGGFPVYAYFYGDFNEAPPQTNWSAGNSSTAALAYYGEESHKQTIMFLAGVHGAEPESVAAAMNMIQLLETGKDYRGETDSTFLSLAANYRLIIVPCLNMDGRAISPDHLSGQPYEVFRAACQGTWKDGSLVGWKDSKKYFPLPLDKVSFPGGYPNADGYNIQHDVTPGDMRTEEAKAACKLMARWRVDFLLNGHSCESQPSMLGPSSVDTGAHIRRGCLIADKVNDALYDSGFNSFRRPAVQPSGTMNLTNAVNWCSGGLGLTLECSSSYDNIHTPTVMYSFEQLMSPPFIAMKVIMQDGLERPLADRAATGI